MPLDRVGIPPAPPPSAPSDVDIGNWEFCALKYCNTYPDLMAAYCDAQRCTTSDQAGRCLTHWHSNGKTQGRQPDPTAPCRSGTRRRGARRGQPPRWRDARFSHPFAPPPPPPLGSVQRTARGPGLCQPNHPKPHRPELEVGSVVAPPPPPPHTRKYQPADLFSLHGTSHPPLQGVSRREANGRRQ